MNVALFDFDGTVTYKDSFQPFILAATRRSRLLLGGLVLGPLIAAYRSGLVSASRTRAAVSRFAFRGRPMHDIESAGENYARVVLPTILRARAMERIAWHKSRGDRVIVVSAALGVYLEPWCHSQHLEVICTQLETRNGIATGMYAGGDCAGPEKSRRVRRILESKPYDAVYAYGDTSEDAELLALADHPLFRWREADGVISRGRRSDHVHIDLDD